MHARTVPIHPPARRVPARSAFTLTEILVVMLIMVLLLAAAVPAFRTLTGSRSIGATENLVRAMLGRARTAALNDKTRLIGVLFYLDPATERTMMVMVSWEDTTLDPEFARHSDTSRYMGWMPGMSYRAFDDTINPPILADVVLFVTEDRDLQKNDGTIGKPMVKEYKCIKPHTSSAVITPPASGNDPFANTYWEEVSSGNLSTVGSSGSNVF